MNRNPHRRRSFFAELKRRNVYRVGAMYVAASFVIWQVADIVGPAFDLPQAFMRFLVIAAVAGLPVVLVLAWVFELTSAGGAHGDRGEWATDADRAGVPFPRALARRLAAGALFLVLLLAGAWWAFGDRLLPGAADPAAHTLAVFPFAVRGSAGVEYLREGLVDLLSRNFSGAEEMNPLDPALVLRAAVGADRIDINEAASIARRIGAGQFVLGAVSQAGAEIRIDATLYALRDSIEAGQTRTVQGDTIQLFRLIDQLTAELLAERATGAASQRLIRTAAVTTASLPALKAFLEGEQRFRAGDHTNGVEAFRRAVDLDSAFGLARHRLAMSHHLRGEHDVAYAESQRSLGHAERLGAQDRRLVEAFHAWHAGSVADAESRLRGVLTEYPRDLEARFILAELLVQYAPLRAQPLTEARRHLEAIIEADPRFACIHCRLGLATLAEGDLTAAGRWLRLGGGLATGDTTRLAIRDRMLIGLMGGDSARIRSALAQADSLPADAFPQMFQVFAQSALMTGDFRAFDEVVERGERRALSRSQGDLARTQRAYSTGRWTDAAATAMELAHTEAIPLEGLAQILVFNTPFDAPIGNIEAMRAAVAAALERQRTAADRSSTGGGATSAGPVAAEALGHATLHTVAGLLASRNGDAAAARVSADNISGIARTTSLQRAGIEGFARTVRADLALRSGDARTALAELEAIGFDMPPALTTAVPYSSGYAPLLRAHAHAALNQSDAALRWLRYGASYFGMPHPMRYGSWQRDVARALDALGRGEEARLHYARFIEAWSGADAALQPQVDHARARLDALLGAR